MKSDHPDLTIAKLWNPFFILIVLLGSLTMMVFLAQMTTISLFVAEKIHANEFQIGLNATIATLFALIFRAVSGWLTDHWKKSYTILIGLIILLFGSVFVYWSQTLMAVYVFSALRGIGFAFVSTACLSMVPGAIPETRLSEGLGYYTLGSMIASAVGPTTGIFIVENYNHFVFWFGSSALLVLLVLFMLTAGLRILSVVSFNEQPVCREKSTSLKGGIIFSQSVFITSLINLFVFIAFSSIITFLPLMAVSRKIPSSGLFFLVQAGAIFVVRIVGAKWGERYGYRQVLLLSLLVLAASYVTMAYVASLSGLILAAVIYGTGSGFVQPMLMSILMSGVSPEKRGMASAVFMAASDIGLSIGSVLLGASGRFIGYKGMYLVASVFILVGLIFIFLSKSEAIGSILKK